MPKIRLNERAIARMRAPDPSGKDILYWDTKTPGFGVRCSGATATKEFVAQRDLPGGKTRRVKIGPVSLSLEVARERAQDELDKLRRNIDPKRRIVVPTLQSTLESYLLARKDLRPGSVRMYRLIERYLKDWMDLPLHDLTGDMVERRHRELAEIIGRSKNPRYSGHTTANFAMRTLRTLWNFAADRTPNMPPNPVRHLKRGGMFPEVRRERMVSAEQLPAFYAAVSNLDNAIARDVILLMLFTGLRRGEATTLRWTEVDLVEGVIRLPAVRTKAARALALPLSDVVHDLLVARRRLGIAGGGYVFPGRLAGHHISDLDGAFAAIAKATGIVVSAHDLRRSFATVAGSTEISPYALKVLLNHSLGSDVTSGYIFLPTPVLRGAAQRIADRLKMLCGIVEVSGENVTRLREPPRK
jgi:integrase